MFLGIVFNCSMEYLVCFCAASLVEKERSKEMKWSYGRAEKVFLQLNACAKSIVIFRPCWMGEGVMFAVRSKSQVYCLWKQTLKSPWFLCVWWFLGEACVSPKMLPRGEMRARCRSRIRHRIDIGGAIKLFLCVAYWIYLIHIQLGSLGLKEIDTRDP